MQWRSTRCLPFLFCTVLGAQESLLPPPLEWNGKSRELIARAGDPWITPAEKSNFRTTPGYDETFAFLRLLSAAAPELRVISLGKSAEGRDILMVVASRDRVFTPDALKRTGKPVIMAQAGIHAGEIDGKDAGLMLLRDMTVGNRRRDLLDRAHFLFIPIFNTDGHERASKYGRINQRGPDVMGWRTTARNLNLNRDYTKLDAEETRAMVAAINHWKPDLYIDLHVTDGADYQYDITWGWNQSAFSPTIVHWLDGTLDPALRRDLTAAGHIPGPLVFPVDDENVSKGIALGNSAARLSHGYGDVRHLPSILVENHSLKPYEQRVLGTVVFLKSILETMGRTGEGLRRAITQDSTSRLDPIPLEWRVPQNGNPPEIMDFRGVEAKTSLSSVSGAVRVEYTGKPVTLRVPVLRKTEVARSVPRTKAYWIPAAWSEIAELIQLHGIQIERIPLAREVDVEMYRLQEPKLAAEAFEGRITVTAKPVLEKRKQRFPQGSWRVSTDQPLGDLVTVLLEPASTDSFFQWGFFHEILQRTEYIENYVTEPLAEAMLAADPKLAEEFRRKLEADDSFRTNADARLRFFYERTPYYDEQWLLYPIAREPRER